jgi:uncharacterized protein
MPSFFPCSKFHLSPEVPSTPETDPCSRVKEYLLDLSRELVDNKDKVTLRETSGEPTNVVELRADKDEIGKLIGRKGRTADALRTVLNCAAARFDKRYVLHIMDEVE